MQATKKKPMMAKEWAEYRKSRDPRIRNLFMERFLPIVRYNAERISAKLPDEVDQGDLESAGVFGLMDAIDAYDPDRGVKFETYCAPRIRGAILDELRSMDWVPRLVRSRSTKLERSCRELEAILGRRPTRDEIASHLGMSNTDFDKLFREASATLQISLSRKHNETDANKDVCEIDVIEDRRGRDPVSDMQKKDLKALITRGLSRAERLILILYYYEEMTMKEIGLTLDLSESRVSQMHSAVVKRLKEQLELRRKELVR